MNPSVPGLPLLLCEPQLRLDGDRLLGEGDLDGLREVRRRGVEAGLVRVPVHHVGQAVRAYINNVTLLYIHAGKGVG